MKERYRKIILRMDMDHERLCIRQEERKVGFPLHRERVRKGIPILGKEKPSSWDRRWFWVLVSGVGEGRDLFMV